MAIFPRGEERGRSRDLYFFSLRSFGPWKRKSTFAGRSRAIRRQTRMSVLFLGAVDLTVWIASDLIKKDDSLHMFDVRQDFCLFHAAVFHLFLIFFFRTYKSFQGKRLYLIQIRSLFLQKPLYVICSWHLLSSTNVVLAVNSQSTSTRTL